jgi:DNA polymerase-3 subunit gamma/tau
MATQSLYRRYRPRRFADLKGQDHVVRALRNAVAHQREGQAYLFSGPRGTGKTSSARILAKVLNCANPVDGEPCCECDSCLAVERGTSYDVHELDAASNNGVDAIRDLIERASLGTPGRHKVYILDEVHMLSKNAEAALLKTLEEPPPHVVFVLATTDPQKVSETIRSRTQHLQFHLLPLDTLAEHVRWVAADAGLDVSEATIDAVLAQGGGSARDTLSALELAANAGSSEVPPIAFDEVLESMIEHDPGRALAAIAHGIQRGRDPRSLTEELIAHLRNGFLALMAPELVQLPSPQIDAVAAQAQRLGAAAIVRGIESLGEVLVEMRHAPDPRVLLDVAIVRLTHEHGTDLSAIVTRLDRLEKAMAERPPAETSRPAPTDPATGRAAIGGRARRAVAASPTAPAAADAAATVATSPATPVSTAAVALDLAAVWETDVRNRLRGMAKALFSTARIAGLDGEHWVLEFPNQPTRDKADQHRHTVEQLASDTLGATVALRLVVEGDGGAPRSARPDGCDDDTSPARRSPTPAAVADDDIDLDELTDAPAATVRTPLDHLAEAFPGSELVDDRDG